MGGTHGTGEEKQVQQADGQLVARLSEHARKTNEIKGPDYDVGADGARRVERSTSVEAAKRGGGGEVSLLLPQHSLSVS